MSMLPASLSKFSNPAAFSRRLSISSTVLWHAVLMVAILTVAFGAVGWRINQAPDVFTDEILYTRLGIRVATEGTLVWDNGRPAFIHPPLYFLIQGMFTALTSHFEQTVYAPGDIFAAVHHARLLNGILAAITGVVLYVLGARLKGAGLGILLVALFVLDPFGVRINRRAMIETLAGLLALSGMALMLASHEKDRWPVVRAIAAGVLMGAGVLTKDLAFAAPLAVLLFGVWELLRTPTEQRRYNAAELGAPFIAAGIAYLSYTLVPLWAATTGYWDRFVRVKTLALQRLIGLVHTSGWNRPGVSLVDILMQRLEAYGTSYLLLAAGGLATLVILVLGRKTRTGRLLAVWGLVIYPLFGFVALFGSGNDQFFYFLLIPAIVLLGYAIVLLVAPERRWTPTQRLWMTTALGVALVAILLINAALWRTNYGVRSDDGYRQLAVYVKENVPAGTQINASGDALKFRYFFPDHVVTDAGLPQEVLEQGIRYFVLAPKDVEARFGKITPELADWITEHGMRLFMATGASYGEIHLYYVDGADEWAEPAPERIDANTLSRTLAPASTGYLRAFTAMLFAWLALWGIVAAWLVYSQARGPKQGIVG
jgi:4-amino-4-deoxy-L-arabinose transferase-like glycosyltransferase